MVPMTATPVRNVAARGARRLDTSSSWPPMESPMRYELSRARQVCDNGSASAPTCLRRPRGIEGPSELRPALRPYARRLERLWGTHGRRPQASATQPPICVACVRGGTFVV